MQASPPCRNMIVVAGAGLASVRTPQPLLMGKIKVNVEDGAALSRWPCDAPEPVLAELVAWPVGYAIRHIAERAFWSHLLVPFRLCNSAARSPFWSEPKNRTFLRPLQTIRRAFSATFLSVSDPPSLTFLTNQFFGLQQCFRFLLAFCAHRPASHLTPLGGHP